MVCGFAQVTTKTETSTKSDGKKHIMVTVKTDGKTTTIDTVLSAGDAPSPEMAEKLTQLKKGAHHIMVKMDSLKGTTFYSDEEDGPKGTQHKRIIIRKAGKDLKDSMFPMEFDIPNLEALKELNFNAQQGPMRMMLRGLPGMNGKLHKVQDEEFAQLRKKGVLTEKEDLAEKLDVRFVNTSPCGEDCQILNFVSKEKGKIGITLVEREGKVVDKTEAGIVSQKEVDGRNVFSCVINLGKDKKFTFIKLTKDGKIALFSNGL